MERKKSPFPAGAATSSGHYGYKHIKSSAPQASSQIHNSQSAGTLGMKLVAGQTLLGATVIREKISSSDEPPRDSGAEPQQIDSVYTQQDYLQAAGLDESVADASQYDSRSAKAFVDGDKCAF